MKAIENLLGIKRGILSDAEVVSKTATEINSSAGDYSLSIMDFQHYPGLRLFCGESIP